MFNENGMGLHKFGGGLFETARMLAIANVAEKNKKVCDVGAGAAHLTLLLAAKGLTVHAVEPNDAMRANGIKRTSQYPNVTWHEGVGEHTGQPANTFDLVTFGSSFNVTNRQEALEETQRILKPGGWFACMWNHRDLTDPVQEKIEHIIKSYVKDYDYGTRREDQTEVINESGRFSRVQAFSGRVVHRISVKDIVDGWRSHGTLYRQVGDRFDEVVREIETYLNTLGQVDIDVPYETHGWMAQVIK